MDAERSGDEGYRAAVQLELMVKFAHSRQFNGRDFVIPKLHCVALRCDENFYGHPGEGTGAADEDAGHRDRLPDVARDRDRNQIEAAEAAIGRVESDPSGSRYEDLRPCMG